MKLFHMLQTFYVLYQFIFKGYFKNLSFHLQQNVLWTAKMTGYGVWGMFGPLFNLLNKHIDLSFLKLMYFSKETFVRNI